MENLEWSDVSSNVLAALALVVSIVTAVAAMLRDASSNRVAARERRQKLIEKILAWSRRAVDPHSHRTEVETTFSEVLAAVLASGQPGSRKMATLLRRIDRVTRISSRSEPAHDAVAGIALSRVRDAVTTWSTSPRRLGPLVEKAGDDWWERMELRAGDAEDPEGGTTVRVG